MLGATLCLSQCPRGMSQDVATTKPLPVAGAEQQGQSPPGSCYVSHHGWLIWQEQGGRARAGGCPSQKKGQWVPGVPGQAEG